MNSNIIDCFQKLTLLPQQNKFKIVSYHKTIHIIKNLDFQITNTNQITNIKGIGKSTCDKINEILNTGTLSQLNSLVNSKDILDLQKITGIGPVKAKSLIKDKITLPILLNINLEHPSSKDSELLNKLTHHQLLGLKYFNDLENRIPYIEINDIELYLKKLIQQHFPNLNLIICGSYRRKKPNSGDIDILLYNKNNINNLTELLKLLISKKFLTDHLTDINNKTKYMGFCKYKILNRRIDIRFISYNSIASALLYFTGSGEFNKNMRKFALSKGYTINEYGIYKLKTDGTKGLKIKTECEKDIFNILNLEYVEPEYRLESYQFI